MAQQRIVSREEARSYLRGFFILDEISTPDGVGTLVRIDVPSDAVNIMPERAKMHVWFGIDHRKNGKISWVYSVHDLLQ